MEKSSDDDEDWQKDRVTDKDDAGSVRGTRPKPKVRHADNNHAKKPQRASSVDGYTPADDGDPNRENNIPEQVVSRLAKFCDWLAEFYAEENGVSKNVAYDALLKSNKLFQTIWKSAMQPGAPQ